MWNRGVIKTGHLIQIKIMMPNPSQEPLVSSEAPNENLKDIDVLCTFKIKIESQNLDHGCIKDQWPYPNQGQDAEAKSWASSVLQSPNEDLKDSDVLGTFKIKIESKIWNMGDHIQIKIKMPNPSKEPSVSSKA